MQQSQGEGQYYDIKESAGFSLNQWMSSAPTTMGALSTVLRKRLECRDGFSMSVQAGEGHYSHPREDHGPYTEVEVGKPSREEELLMPYIEQGYGKPTAAVYPYVPVEVVEDVVNKHGGLR